MRRLEDELDRLKDLVLEPMSKVSFLEDELKESKELMFLSKHHDNIQRKKLKAYEKADELRVQLIITKKWTVLHKKEK